MNQGYDLRIVCSLRYQVKEGKAATKGLEPINLTPLYDLFHELLII
jgi:hypothetical protein